MYKQNDKPGDILLRDWREYIHNGVGQEQWVTVYASNRGEWGATYFFSALIPNSKVIKSLKNESWDLTIGTVRPGCSEYHGAGGQKKVTYHRFGSRDGVEPLIHCREFHGIKKDYVEVSEEFRLFHNLYHDKVANKFIRIDESGAEEDVILIQDDRVQIKLKPLKQYLAIREMHLAVFFSVDRYSDKTPAELGMKPGQRTVQQDKLRYWFFFGQHEFSIRDDKPTYSRLEGKKLIPGMSKEKSGIWPYEEQEKYEDFIIGTDENGDPILYTCNPDELANFFGKNPHAPQYVKPVFFKREVLTKYYAKPDMYSVEDGHLRCGSLWDLRMDNNHEQYVIVFLGDLGRDLPAAERGYWRSYNVPPDGGISAVNWKRNFMAQFTDPEKADLVFKYQFNMFQDKWAKRYGWTLLKPLSESDEHNFKVLRVPVSDDQAEFDQQSMALTKVLVDSLNEDEIKSQITGKIDKDAKGISKLAQWLREQGCTDADPHVKFLRSLQDLRNGAGHRKGDAYQRGAAHFKLEETPLSKAFEEILMQAVELLKYLEERLIQTGTDDMT